jgi:hypothetical protein
VQWEILSRPSLSAGFKTVVALIYPSVSALLLEFATGIPLSYLLS